MTDETETAESALEAILREYDNMPDERLEHIANGGAAAVITRGLATAILRCRAVREAARKRDELGSTPR